MAFQEKSALSMSLVLLVVYGGYFGLVGWLMATRPLDEIAFQPLMIVALVPLIVLAALSQIGIALFSPRDAVQPLDERDRMIAARAGSIGGWALAVTVFGGIALAMLEADALVIANGLLLGWVLAQLVEYGATIVLYRRGV